MPFTVGLILYTYTYIQADIYTLTLSHMASEVLFTIWQGGQLASPVRTTLATVKTILGADYTLAMLCSIIVFSRVWEGG